MAGDLGFGAFPAVLAAEWFFDAGMPVVGVVVVFGLVLVLVAAALAVSGAISMRRNWPAAAELTPAERREVDVVVTEGGCPDDLRLVPAARELALLRAGDPDGGSSSREWLRLLLASGGGATSVLSLGLRVTAAVVALATIPRLVLSLRAPSQEENRHLAMQAAHAARARQEQDDPVGRPSLD